MHVKSEDAPPRRPVRWVYVTASALSLALTAVVPWPRGAWADPPFHSHLPPLISSPGCTSRLLQCGFLVREDSRVRPLLACAKE
jgi:hypothetical protein